MKLQPAEVLQIVHGLQRSAENPPSIPWDLDDEESWDAGWSAGICEALKALAPLIEEASRG